MWSVGHAECPIDHASIDPAAAVVGRRSSVVVGRRRARTMSPWFAPCVPCGRGGRARALERARARRRTDAFTRALTPRAGESPGPLLKRVMDEYGGMHAGVAREAFESAFAGAGGRGGGDGDDARGRVLGRFIALCDWPRVERPRLRETFRALADASEDGYWLPESLDGGIVGRLGHVEGLDLDHMSGEQARAFFVYAVTQFDVVGGAPRCTFEEFMMYFMKERGGDRVGGELGEAHALFDGVKRMGVVAWQYLEMFDDPKLNAFSSETKWIERGARRDGPRRGAVVTQFAQDAEMMTTAIRAARLNRPREIERLVVEDGFDVNARDAANKRQTLLMIAAANGNKAACKKLLILGADACARDDTGRTTVDVANDYNHFVLAEYLNSHGVPTAAQLDSGAREFATIERAAFSFPHDEDISARTATAASAPSVPSPSSPSRSPSRSRSRSWSPSRSPSPRAWGDESELLTPE